MFLSVMSDGDIPLFEFISIDEGEQNESQKSTSLPTGWITQQTLLNPT